MEPAPMQHDPNSLRHFFHFRLSDYRQNDQIQEIAGWQTQTGQATANEGEIYRVSVSLDARALP